VTLKISFCFYLIWKLLLGLQDSTWSWLIRDRGFRGNTVRGRKSFPLTPPPHEEKRRENVLL
jgi:hypothetical protein